VLGWIEIQRVGEDLGQHGKVLVEILEKQPVLLGVGKRR